MKLAGGERAASLSGAARGAAMLAGLLAVGVAARLVGTASFTHAPGAGGAVGLVMAGALLAASGVPRQAVAFAGGLTFGLWEGASLALLAQMLGCALDFWLARGVGRGWAVRHLRGRLARLDGFLAGNPFTATLTLRLLPVGNNLVLNLVAGVSGMKAWPFLAATLLGYLPQTAIFALAGSGVHVGQGVQLGVGAALFVASALLGFVLLKTARTPADPDRAPFS